MEAVACIFCDNERLSREHVYGGAWIKKLIPGATGFTNTMFKGEGNAVEQVGEWPSSGADVVVRCVCRECNHGWMNHVDLRAEAMLTEMAHATQPFRVIDGELEVFATWATKVAFVMSGMHTPVPVRRDDREFLRKNLVPPSGVQIWVATMESYEFELRTTPTTLRSGPERGGVEQAFLATFRLLHLVVQVLAPMEDVTPEHDEFGVLHAEFAWPRTAPLEVPLPPERMLKSEDDMKRLAQSFRVPISWGDVGVGRAAS